MGCSYCGKSGCRIETCEERLEDAFGLSGEYAEGGDREAWALEGGETA